MKKLSLKNLNLGANDLLQRNQLKTVFGGDGGYGGNSGSGSGLCTCKLGASASASTNTNDCNNCGDLCAANYPSYTSWICSGA